MKSSEIRKSSFGRLVPTIGGQKAFVPDNLPPRLKWTSGLAGVLSEADRAIGQLHGGGLNLPNPNLLIRPFVRREAEMSSRIEGTQATMQELYLFELDERPVEARVPDVREVANYVGALEYGLERIQELPVCLRVIRELHGILLRDVRGEDRLPGEFRTDQNWIGSRGCSIEEASYVPPPVAQMHEGLDAFEKFVNEELRDWPVLVWLAMVHYQFEALHPFRDGNGRIGRLLITLLLCSTGVLDKPLLYLSAYFERRRQEYYERLLEVSTHGRWVEWLVFFLRGVAEQARDAFARTRVLLELQQGYQNTVRAAKGSATQIRLVDLLIEHPVVTIGFVSSRFNVTYAAARQNVRRLVQAGVLKELTGRKRNRFYMAEGVLDVISKTLVIS